MVAEVERQFERVGSDGQRPLLDKRVLELFVGQHSEDRARFEEFSYGYCLALVG